MDTGALVSAFAFGGIPEMAIKKAFAEAELFVSPDLLKEYRDVPLALEGDGKLTHGQLKALISGLAAFVTRAIIVNPKGNCLSAETRKTICYLNVALKRRQGSSLAGTKTSLT